MISTLTTSTDFTLTASLGLIVILVLVALLVMKEISSTEDAARQKRLNATINIGLVPLLIVFILIVAVRLMQALK
jgi:hypothetical protein